MEELAGKHTTLEKFINYSINLHVDRLHENKEAFSLPREMPQPRLGSTAEPSG